jgi:hypothetical protein
MYWPTNTASCQIHQFPRTSRGHRWALITVPSPHFKNRQEWENSAIMQARWTTLCEGRRRPKNPRRKRINTKRKRSKKKNKKWRKIQKDKRKETERSTGKIRKQNHGEHYWAQLGNAPHLYRTKEEQKEKQPNHTELPIRRGREDKQKREEPPS